MISKEFFIKFTIPELKQISGKRYSRIIILFSFLTLVLIAIGISKGAVNYLKIQMDSRYVALTSVKIPSGFDQSIIQKLSKINNSNGIIRTFPVYEEIRTFVNPNDSQKKYKTAQIRKGMLNDPILDDFHSNNPKQFNYKKWGAVVTRGFLKELGYSNDIPYVTYLKIINDEKIFINIPVEGIVDDLPDNLDMVVGEKLFQSFEDVDYWRSLINTFYNSKNLRLFITEINDEISNNLSKYNFNKINHDIFSNGHLYEVNNIDSVQIQNIILEFEINNINVFQVYGFDYQSLNVNNVDFAIEKYVFEFHEDSLYMIEKFNNVLMSEYRDKKKFLKIDLSIINSKNNFDVIKNLVKFLSMAIKILSFFSIFLFLWNLIMNHIDSNKKNLGTLKAFGLSNFNIVGIYSFISLAMIFISLTFSYLLSIFLGNNIIYAIINLMDLDNLIEMKFMSESIINLFTIFIAAPAIFLVVSIYLKLKAQTPGDLIYERNNN